MSDTTGKVVDFSIDNWIDATTIKCTEPLSAEELAVLDDGVVERFRSQLNSALSGELGVDGLLDSDHVKKILGGEVFGITKQTLSWLSARTDSLNRTAVNDGHVGEMLDETKTLALYRGQTVALKKAVK